MQKLSKNAYILIWSIFLSLMIGVSFISISNNVTKNLKINYQIRESININKKVENSIKNAIINNDFSQVDLGNNQILVFENNNINIGLKEDEEINIRFFGEQNVTIIINEGSPVEYYNINDSNISGIIFNTQNISTGTGELNIKNLGGYSNIKISSDGFFHTPIKNYKIFQKIGNKNIVKENNFIKLF